MIKILKKSNYYVFSVNESILKTNNNNDIKIDSQKKAAKLKAYLDLFVNKRNKGNFFFMKILFFNFDLNKKNRCFYEKKILEKLNTDLLCYRAEKGSELSELQKEMFDPLLIFVRKKFNLNFNTTNSIMPFSQDSVNITKLGKVLKNLKKTEFSTYFFISNFSNSNIIALNFLANNIKSDYIWDCISLDERYSFKKWGVDKEANNILLEKRKDFLEIIRFNLLFNS